MNQTNTRKVVAVCGKGGVGKTAFSALLARVMMQAGVKPLLLVDADPVGGLISGIGESINGTLAGVKEKFISEVMALGRDGADEAAGNLNYFLLQALTERDDYSLLAMGHTTKKGCFCSANTLLRQALGQIIDSFAGVIIDAEAGIEQINREVTKVVDHVFVIADASERSYNTLLAISDLVQAGHISVVMNRISKQDLDFHHLGSKSGNKWEQFPVAGIIPEDETLRDFDILGKSLWQLPDQSPAVVSVHKIFQEFSRINQSIHP